MLLIAAFMLVALVPLASLGIKILSQGESFVKERASSYLEGLAERNAESITRFMVERINDVKNLADLIGFSGVGRERLRAHFSGMQGHQTPYLGFALLDASGKVVFSTLDDDADFLQFHSHNKGRLEWLGALVGDVFMKHTEYGLIPVMVVCSPLGAGDGGAYGRLCALVDFRAVGDLLKKSRMEITGEVYLVDEQGWFLCESRFGARTLENKIDVTTIANRAKGIYETPDYRGERVLQAFEKLPDLPWYVIADQDMSEILNDLKRLEKEAVLYGFLTALIVFCLALFVSSRIVNILKAKYQYEKELEFQVIQKEKLASLGLLTSGLAHELNTPLANALLYTQIAKEDLDETGLPLATVQDKLATVADEIRQGSRIVRNLLDYSRHSQTDSEKTDCNRILAKLLDIAGPHCTSNKIKVEMDLQEGMPEICAHASAFQAIVTNLTTNAIEAMSDGGTLSLTTRYEPVSKMVEIRLADTGPGIPKEELIKIFNPFYTTKNPGEGTGLGLFISHEMARKLGGDIKVVSHTEGGGTGRTGTVFFLQLPAE